MENIPKKIYTPSQSLSFQNIILTTLINSYEHSGREASSGRRGCLTDTPNQRTVGSWEQQGSLRPLYRAALPSSSAHSRRSPGGGGFVSRAGLPPPAAAQGGSGGAVQHPGAESRRADGAPPCKGHAQARPGAARTWRRTCSSSGSCREYRGGEGRQAGCLLEEQSLQGCIPARPLESENAVTDGRIGPEGEKPFSSTSCVSDFFFLDLSGPCGNP